MLPQPILVGDEEINEYTKPCYCFNSIKNTWDDDVVFYQGTMPKYHYKGFQKIIAGIPELPSIDFSALSEEDSKKIGWVDVETMALNSAHANKHNTISEHQSHSRGFIEGFKSAQSLNEKKFSEEDMNGFSKWLDENWRRGKTKKGSGWFHVGDFYKQSKPVKTENLMSKYIQSLSQPKVFDIIAEPVTNNSIKVIKVL